MTVARERKKIIVLGANSAIAEATSRMLAEQGAHLVLAGRKAERLRAIADDLAVRGANSCEIHEIDLANPHAAETSIAQIAGGTDTRLDAVLLFYGHLGDTMVEASNLEEMLATLNVNFTSAAAWCMAVARRFEQQGSGILVVVGSVAGDRGRQSNYVYGAAKAGIATFVQGLAHRLAFANAQAVIVKPGFVDTPMTRHIQPKGMLWAKPEAVAHVIVRCIRRRKSCVAYAPWYWRWIMLIIRLLPGSILYRTRL